METRSHLLLDRDSGNGQNQPEVRQSPEDRALVAAITTHWQERERWKRPYEKTWYVNHAALVGQHYLVWNDYTRNFDTPHRTPSHRVRLVIPFMLQYWRRTVARLTAHAPTMLVVPETADEIGAQEARSNQRVLDAELSRLDYSQIRRDGTGWAIESGNVIYHVRWNPHAGPALTDPATGQPVLDESGAPLHRGDIEIDIGNPFEFDADPKASCVKEAEWVMRNVIRSLDWIQEHYPERGAWVKAEPVYAHSYYLKRVRAMAGLYGNIGEGSTAQESDESAKNSAVVHEYWEKASRKHPQGRFVVVAGGVVLHNGPNPYKAMLDAGFPFPFVHTGEIKVPGRFWYMAMIEQAFPLNRNYNKARSQEVENRTLHGRPKILVPKVCRIRLGSFDPEPGEKIEYTQGPRGERPEIMYPQSTTQATQVETAHTKDDLAEVLSAHEASRGIMPSANAPAEALRLLQTADETVLGLTEANFRTADEAIAKMILALAGQFWTEQRLVRIVGAGGGVESYKIGGGELGKPHDVRMVPMSSMWRDPERQRATVAQLIELQILNPQQNRDIILKALDLASLEDVFADDRLDEVWAARENELMEGGTQPVPRDFENHGIHIKVHDRYRKSDRYRGLAPEWQALVDQHVATHKQLIVDLTKQLTMDKVETEAPVVAADAVMEEAEREQALAAPAETPAPSQPEV